MFYYFISQNINWYIDYFTSDSEKLTVATTRPETLLGDTALAVNPKDERYKGQIGKMALLPIVNREIKFPELRLLID